MTCAQPGSGWTRWHTIDIVFDTVSMLRNIFDRYVGDGNSLQKRNALRSDIRDTLKKQPTLVGSDFDLIMSQRDKQIGRIIIELDLIPEGELQRIKSIVSINAQLE
jgi:hypothetical protein